MYLEIPNTYTKVQCLMGYIPYIETQPSSYTRQCEKLPDLSGFKPKAREDSTRGPRWGASKSATTWDIRSAVGSIGGEKKGWVVFMPCSTKRITTQAPRFPGQGHAIGSRKLHAFWKMTFDVVLGPGRDGTSYHITIHFNCSLQAGFCQFQSQGWIGPATVIVWWN